MPHDTLDSDVLDRLGLDRQPFEDEPGDDFLYSDPAIDVPAKIMLDRTHDSSPIILLRGDPGSGKSTQILRFLSRAGSDLAVCAFKAHDGADLDDVATALIEWRKKEGREVEGQTVREIVEDMLVVGEKPVIVVDDADRLAPDALAALLRLRTDFHDIDGNTFCLLLAGPPVLEERLTTLGPDAANRIVVPLRPLTQDQAAAYLRHRLQAAGNDHPDFLTDDLVRRIVEQSGGLFGRINEIARKLLSGEAPESPPIRAVRDEDAAVGEEAVPDSAEAAPGRLSVVIDDDEPGMGGSAGVAADTGDSHWRPGGKRFMWLVIAVLGVGMAVAAVSILVSLGGKDDEQIQRLELPPPEPHKVEEAAAPTEEPPAGEAAEGEGRVQPEPVTEAPMPARESAPEPEPAPPSTAPQQPAPEPPKVEEPEPAPRTASAPPSAPKPAPVAKPASGGEGAAWVRSQKSAWYTIQVAGFSTEKSVRNFARNQGLEGKSHWVRTRRNGADWYVLLSGSYPSADAARGAIAKLPAGVRANNPWIRTFGSVTAVMR